MLRYLGSSDVNEAIALFVFSALFASFAVKSVWLTAECFQARQPESSSPHPNLLNRPILEQTGFRANIPGVPGPHGNGNTE